MKPTVKRIMDQLGDNIAKEQGRDKVKATAIAIRKAMDTLSVDDALDEINGLLHGYGIEAIQDNEVNSFYGINGLLYVNMGDTYISTILYDTRKRHWYAVSWGDVVESQEKRFWA